MNADIEADQEDPSFRGWIAAIVLLAVAVRGWMLTQPVGMWDGRVMPDDAWLYLELARGIAEQGEPVFEGSITNGFHPLFAFVLAGLFKVLDPDLTTLAGLDSMVTASQCVGVVADLGCLAMILAHTTRRFGKGPAVYLAGFLWALHPATIASSLNGMETTLSLFMFLVLWWRFDVLDFVEDSASRTFVFGCLVGVAILTRLDLLLLGLLYAWDSFGAGRQSGWAKKWWASNLTVGAGFAAVYGTWAAYSLATMDRVFPDSGKAVRLVASNATNHEITPELFGMTFGGIASQQMSTAPVLAGLGLLTVWACFRTGRLRELAWLRVPAFFTVAIFFAYGLVIWSFFRRYGYPSIALFLPLVVSGAYLFFGSRRRFVQAAAAVGLVGVVWAAHPFAGELVGEPDEDVGYRRMAIWVREHSPQAATIGAPQCGALAYYAGDRRVVNLDGVVSREAYDAVRTKTLHKLMADRSVDVVIGRDFDIQWIRMHSTGFDERYEQLGYVSGVKGWGWEVWRIAGATPSRD